MSTVSKRYTERKFTKRERNVASTLLATAAGGVFGAAAAAATEHSADNNINTGSCIRVLSK